jgi:tetratricopeptide (TPR) repeat protein
MKKSAFLNLNLKLIPILGLALLSGCTLSNMIKKAKEQKLTVVPSPLELHGDSVQFTLSAELPTKLLRKGKTYTLFTTYNYLDQKLQLPEVIFDDKMFPNFKTEGPRLSKKFSFAYKSQSMDRGSLTLKGGAANLNGKTKYTPEMEVAKGLILTSRLVQPSYFVAYADHGYNKEPEYEPTTLDFNFDQGSSKLKVKKVKQKAAKGKKAREVYTGTAAVLDAYIAAKNPTKTVTIVGMHSPEGREVKNVFLAEDRAKTIERFYKQVLKENGYARLADSIQFVPRSLIQVWGPFKDTLAALPGFSDEEKRAVFAIIDGPGTFVEQQQKIEELEFFPRLFVSMYHKLRLAKTEILTLKPKKSDAEIEVLAKQIVDGSIPNTRLKDNELLYAASLTPISTEKEAIFLAATKQNDSWIAHNNLGAVRLEMAIKATDKNVKTDLIDRAVANLEIAKAKQPAPEVFNNLGMAYLMKNNDDKALEAFKSGLAAKPRDFVARMINSGKGQIEIRKATYPAAVASLTSATDNVVVDFNKGLAQLLNRDYNAALASFEEALAADSKYALASYCAAIAAARLNREADVSAYLRKAVSANESLKAKALADMEFINFAEKPSFKDALR